MRLRNQEGFTLLEVIAAVGVFAFGMLALCRLQAATVVSNSMSNEMTKANTLIQERMETLMTWPIKDPGNGNPYLRDADGSGTGKDSNGDGVDDTPTRNFGLGYATSNSPTGPNADTGTVLADDCITIDASTNQVTSNAQGSVVTALSANQYRIFQNIGLDIVLPNTRTISLIIMWRDSKNILHRSSMASIKSLGT